MEEWLRGLQLAVPLWCSLAQLLTLSLMTKLTNQENFWKKKKKPKAPQRYRLRVSCGRGPHLRLRVLKNKYTNMSVANLGHPGILGSSGHMPSRQMPPACVPSSVGSQGRPI